MHLRKIWTVTDTVFCVEQRPTFCRRMEASGDECGREYEMN